MNIYILRQISNDNNVDKWFKENFDKLYNKSFDKKQFKMNDIKNNNKYNFKLYFLILAIFIISILILFPCKKKNRINK